MPKPSLTLAIISHKCPNCRTGAMFSQPNPYKLKQLFTMPKHCQYCHQKFEIEQGFWWGTGYVSYALTVALSIFNVVWWYFLVGFTFNTSKITWYFITNTLIIILLMPYIIRLSRVIYLYFFVGYQTGTRYIDPTSDVDK